MTPLIKSRSLRIVLATGAILIMVTGIALLRYDGDVGAVCLLVGGIVGALPLGDFIRCPPSERVVRPIMQVLLVVALLGGLAAIVFSIYLPDLALVALPVTIICGAVSGFYFGIRVGGSGSEKTKPVEPIDDDPSRD